MDCIKKSLFSPVFKTFKMITPSMTDAFCSPSKSIGTTVKASIRGQCYCFRILKHCLLLYRIKLQICNLNNSECTTGHLRFQCFLNPLEALIPLATCLSILGYRDIANYFFVVPHTWRLARERFMYTLCYKTMMTCPPSPQSPQK